MAILFPPIKHIPLASQKFPILAPFGPKKGDLFQQPFTWYQLQDAHLASLAEPLLLYLVGSKPSWSEKMISSITSIWFGNVPDTYGYTYGIHVVYKPTNIPFNVNYPMAMGWPWLEWQTVEVPERESRIHVMRC